MLRSPFPYIIWLLLLAWPGSAAAQQPRGGRAAVPAVRLPPIPAERGALALHVVYPTPNEVISARDSNFIFGSTGNGQATLTINGDTVPVAPNGAFLAWLPVVGDTAEVYHLVARLGEDSVTLDHRVRLPRRFAPPAEGLWLDAGSIEPRGMRWAEPGELIRVGVRAAPGSTVILKLPDGTIVPLAPDTGSLSPAYGPFDRQPARAGQREVTRYAGFFPAQSPLGAPLFPAVGPRLGVSRLNPVPMVNQVASPDSAEVPAPPRSDSALVMVSLGPDTVRAPLPLRLAILDAQRRPVVVLDDDTARAGTTDGAVAGKPLPDGTVEWSFRNGTVAAVSGRAGDHVRLALSRLENIWVAATDVAGVLPEGTPPPYSRVALVRLTPGDSSVVARVAMSARLPYKIEESDRALTLRIYSARADLDWLQYGGTDPLVRRMSWAQPSEDEVTVTFELSRPVFGYRVSWQGTDLLLEMRRPPTIDRVRPLRGRVIAVDPGHPPVGATGPTGFMEKDANLAVGLALRDLLVRAGARVIMTRSTDTSIGLYERTNLAEAANAELLISIHNNAFPDGVNPFINNGTSAYYFQPRASRLAFLVQDAMVRQMGLGNLGIGRGDLALVRPTWMPAVLCEGAFLMIPEQENALKTPSFQQRYARGVMQGIEAYLKELAQ
jgi:N-acetylmuramoyl-L-alanine amidase